MNIGQAIILGIVQGLGEFLPISSTAHLILVPHFLSWQDPGLAFDVALHTGTLLALLIFFRQDWWEIFKSGIDFWRRFFQANPKKMKNQNFNQNFGLTGFLILATIPGALAGFFLGDWVENFLRNPLTVATTLLLGAILLGLADKIFAGQKKIQDMKIKNSIIIGIAQAIAIIPGVSRSGATITAGLWQGFSRQQATRFSFLLSAPIIFGATLMEVPKLLNGKIESTILFFGILSSMLSGYLAIAFLLKFVQNKSFAIFVWYRIFLAGLIFIVYF